MIVTEYGPCFIGIPHNIGIKGKNASEEDGNIFYVMDNNNELYYYYK